MSRAARASSAEPDLLRHATEAEDAAGALLTDAINAVGARVSANGALSASLLEREQHATHGLAWLATYVEVIRQLSADARRMHEAGRLGETERLLVIIGLGETLAQIFGGIPMSQGEIVRLSALGLADDRIEQRKTRAVKSLIADGTTAAARAKLAEFIKESQGTVGDDGLDETLEAMRKEMRRFADAEVVPHAHGWHLKNQYIPLEVIAHMAELGVFGLTIPEEYGGLASARNRCASSPMNCRAAISASVRSAR